MPTAQPTGDSPRSSVTLIAWQPSRQLDFPEWAAAGRRLGALGRCCQWTIGDWIRYGHSRFGERYAPAAQITGYDVQTLMNMVHVASKFEISRRRKTLSWSHHETVAALTQDEQEYWLERSIADKFSIADLRTEVRASRRARPSATETSPARSESDAVIAGSTSGSRLCPRCGQPLPSPRSRRP